MLTTNLGFPRIGPERELKRALEAYWQGKLDSAALMAEANNIRDQAWRLQKASGLDLVPTGDFSLYDHVLDHVVMFGAIPPGYGWDGGPVSLETYFALSRGNTARPALEMTKWFNSNYHYISTNLTERFELTHNKALSDWSAAANELGAAAKPVIIGPLTFLRLANNPAGIPLERLLQGLLPVYGRILAELAEAGVEWIQIDEPWAVQDLTPEDKSGLESAYAVLAGPGVKRPKLMLQTYFDDVSHNWRLVMDLPVEGVGLDFVRGPENFAALTSQGFPANKVLGAGLVDGRNVWRTDLAACLERLDRIAESVPPARAWLGPSSSLLHLPHTVRNEISLDPGVRTGLAFATERLAEIETLRRAVRDGRDAVTAELAENAATVASRRADPRTRVEAVRARVAGLAEAETRRTTPASQRLRLQTERLGLPPLPTTTIGSFPQTAEVRRARSQLQRGVMSESAYMEFVDEQMQAVVQLQEDLGLDVLVHGEFERSDMVDYFAQRLEGMYFIEGWVQSYGSRCVRPPIIYGDIHRPAAMTVDVSRRAQAMTKRPMKGMLTGPVTMLFWSFPRDDLPLNEIADQLALALRDEVVDLEQAGIPIIQIDEPAFREGLPLQHADWGRYVEWSTRAFRIASSGVRDDTQIHTHMCYSEFNALLDAIAALDADVLSIENSRSAGELLHAFRDYDYGRGIGPGVYDVHSARVPSAKEMADLLRRSAQVIAPELLWVNPDCGLKTRGYAEVEPAL